MRSLLVIAVLISTSAMVTVQAEPTSLGYHPDVTVIPPSRTDCPEPPVYAHNGTFENGYCWNSNGTMPPYYGAFGEAYDEGPCTIMCVALWLTQVGGYEDWPADIYIWEGGISGEPGSVVWMKPGVVFDSPAMWPTISQHDIRVNLVAGLNVEGEFTVGYWADFYSSPCQLFVAADEDNTVGHPWTNISPGIGYPTGWNHPGVVWGTMELSLGLGVFIDRGTSDVGDWLDEGDGESSTWGHIKGLFDR